MGNGVVEREGKRERGRETDINSQSNYPTN
jgi:hypothetical protein